MEGGKDSVKEKAKKKEKAHKAKVRRNTYNGCHGLNHRTATSDTRYNNRVVTEI